MVRFSHDVRSACIRNGIKTLERTPELSVEEQFELVREHFRLCDKKTIVDFICR